MSVDIELIKRKINLILEDMGRLRELTKLTIDDFLLDYRHEILAERLLERIIGRVIDINYHIVTENLLITPKDYRDSFLKLIEIGVLKSEFAQKFAKLAGLRNRLAHEYNGLDKEKIFQAAKEIVLELPYYLKAVDNFLLEK
mgnify:CR=1 FL=1